MQLKICGLKFEDNLNNIVQNIMPNYIGLIFYNKSPRYFVDTLPQQAILNVPSNVKKVGVFVNESTENIINAINYCNLQVVQLHGNESPEQCEILKKHAIIFKAFGVDDNFDFDAIKSYENTIDYFLFDTKTTQHGGSGKAFNWQLLEKYSSAKPFILSGGICNAQIEEIKKLKNKPALIDVNSKYELEPGLKDLDKLNQLIKILNND